LKQLDPFLERLSRVCDHHNRDLTYDRYLCLYLLAFFNPILTSLRALGRAADLPHVRKALGLKGRPSLGSLSEAAHVFPAEQLMLIIDALAGQVVANEPDIRLRQLTKTLTAVDGTLLPALPRMVWALWLDDQHRAAKVHLQYEILKGTPVRADVTDANASEVQILQATLQSGRLYVLDRGYRDYGLFCDIVQAQSSFVARIRDNAILKVVGERPLTEADRKAGVVSDCSGFLGSEKTQRCPQGLIRIVEVRGVQNGKPSALRLATDLLDLPADLIALIYKHRWAIELFFRWMKCILRVRHLFSQSPNGIQIQVYAAIIATLLMVLWFGVKPTKALHELMCFYLMGWASLDDVMARIPSKK
jgi:hypothetical protein